MRIATLRCVLLLSALCCGSVSSGQNYHHIIDRLKSELVESPPDSSRVKILNEISFNFRRLNPDSMIPYAEQAYEQALRLNYIRGQAIAQKNMGVSKFKSGAPMQQIINHYQQAIDLSASINDHSVRAACLNNIALVKRSSNLLSDALEYFYRALEIYEENQLDNDYVKGLIIGNIGTTFQKIGDIENEVKYIEEVITYAEFYDFPKLQSIYLDNLASAYVDMGEYEKAVEQCRKAMTIQQKLGDDESYLQSLMAMAEAQVGLGNEDAAIQYAQECIDLAHQKRYLLIKAEALMTLTKAYHSKGQAEEATKAGVRAFEVLSESKRFSKGNEIALLLSNIYKEKGNLEKALYYLDWHQSAHKRRSLDKEKFITANLNKKFNSEIEKRKLETISQNNIIRQRAIYILSLFLIILTLLLWGSFLLYRKSQRTYKQLAIKNKALEKEELNSLQKNNMLQKYIESNIQLEQFAHIASHDLKSPLRTISSFTGLLKMKTINKLSEAETGYLDYIEKAVKQMNDLINDLLVFSKVNSQKLLIESFSLQELLTEIIESLEEAISKSGASINLNDLPSVIVADKNKLHRVLQNLIANAIKFVDPESTPVITIEGNKSETHYTISIEDQGIGICEKFITQIFNPYTQLHTKKEYEGTGLGLSICKKIIDQHQGEISVKSNLGEGSIFTIKIPVSLSQMINSENTTVAKV